MQHGMTKWEGKAFELREEHDQFFGMSLEETLVAFLKPIVELRLGREPTDNEMAAATIAAQFMVEDIYMGN